MNKVSVIYWSGTGNTEKMANAIVEGAKTEGAEVSLLHVGQASIDDVKSVEKIAFGCPAMGAEELEDMEMRPFMDSVSGLIAGKKVLLFGSYEWADGQWMREWKDEVEDLGANLIDAYAAYDNPDENAMADLKTLGKELAKA